MMPLSHRHILQYHIVIIVVITPTPGHRVPAATLKLKIAALQVLFFMQLDYTY